jgi:hypothetical protein
MTLEAMAGTLGAEDRSCAVGACSGVGIAPAGVLGWFEDLAEGGCSDQVGSTSGNPQ